MDPVSALGLASAILAFVDFGTKVFRGTKKLYDSHSDALEENASSESVARYMQRFSAELSTPNPANSTLTGHDAELCELASECKKIADELVRLLEGLKRTDPKSWTQALRLAWKNEIHRSKKEDLGKRLESCRCQFQLQLNYYTSKETSARLTALLETCKDNSIQIQKLHECVVRLQEIMSASVLDNTAKDQVQQLLRLPEKVVTSVAQEKVLEGVRFSNMDQRFGDIRAAHSETFKWLFSTQDAGPQNLLSEDASVNRSDDRKEREEQDTNRQMFAQWLSSGHGIFHFSAKLGAGKSTLMKEAYRHEFVKARLREWADSHELIIGHFFFWKSGTTYQKTLDGMLRGLLHHVLRSQPGLIPLLLPSHWNEAFSTPWQVRKDIDISDDDVRTSFESLISTTANGGNMKLRLFFFIDGLDEMEENTTHTYQDLVETIREWILISSGNVKVCASSREYAVFLNGFPESQRLHLHRLTKLDMHCYVRDKLRSIPDPDNIDRLSREIVEKAQGIFFWVALVTKNIRQQLGDGALMDELLDQIDGLPDGLFELFRHVLMSLETPVRKIAYETFAMMEEGLSWNISVLAIGYAFFKDLKKQQPDFAMTHFNAMNHTTAMILELSRMELRRYCKGLVEISDDGYYSGLAFAHRSVRDFLLEPDTAKAMEASNSHSDIRGALSRIVLLSNYLHHKEKHMGMQEKAGHTAGLSNSISAWYLGMLSDVLYMREEHNLDTEPYTVLRCVDAAHWPMVQECWERDRTKAWAATENVVSSFYVPFKRKKSSMLYSRHYPFMQGTYPDIQVISPMMMLMQMGSPDYAIWQARNCPELRQDGLRISLLICCALSFHLDQHSAFTSERPAGRLGSPYTGPDIIRALLDEGLVSPDLPMPCVFPPLWNKARDQQSLPSLLQVVFMATALVAGDQNTGWAGSIIEALLQQTAVLDFTISLDLASSQHTMVYIRPTDTQSGRQTEWAFKVSSRWHDVAAYIDGVQDWGPERIVEACAFENNLKDRILSLIRGQTSQTDCLLEASLPSDLKPEKNPPVPLDNKSTKTALLSHAVETWGWIILLIVGIVLGTLFSKLFAF